MIIKINEKNLYNLEIISEYKRLKAHAGNRILVYSADGYGTEYVTNSKEHDIFKDETADKPVFTLYDIGVIFSCSREKALKIMHLMKHYECSFKMGKNWYTTKDKIEEFLNLSMGQEIEI